MTRSDPTELDNWFSKLRAVYPRRKGGQGFAVAKKRFAQALKSTSHEVIINAASQYAEECYSVGLKDTPFIKMLATWLYQECWVDYLVVDTVRDIPRWVNRDSPEWATVAAIYRSEKGTQPPTSPGLGGHGWYFPASWLEKGAGGAFDHTSPGRSDGTLEKSFLDRNESDVKFLRTVMGDQGFAPEPLNNQENQQSGLPRPLGPTTKGTGQPPGR